MPIDMLRNKHDLGSSGAFACEFLGVEHAVARPWIGYCHPWTIHPGFVVHEFEPEGNQDRLWPVFWRLTHWHGNWYQWYPSICESICKLLATVWMCHINFTANWNVTSVRMPLHDARLKIKINDSLFGGRKSQMTGRSSNNQSDWLYRFVGRL